MPKAAVDGPMARSMVRAATVARGREPRLGVNAPEGAVGRIPVRRTVSQGQEPPNVRAPAHPRVNPPGATVGAAGRPKESAAGPPRESAAGRPRESAAAHPRMVSDRAGDVLTPQRPLTGPKVNTHVVGAPRTRGPADAVAPTVHAIPVNATAAMRPHPKGAAVPRATEAAGEEAVVAADGATPVRATTVPGGSVSSPRPGNPPWWFSAC